MNGFGRGVAVLTAPASALGAALHRIFPAARRRPRKHPLFLDHFLDDSEMEREMHHL